MHNHTLQAVFSLDNAVNCLHKYSIVQNKKLLYVFPFRAIFWWYEDSSEIYGIQPGVNTNPIKIGDGQQTEFGPFLLRTSRTANLSDVSLREGQKTVSIRCALNTTQGFMRLGRSDMCLIRITMYQLYGAVHEPS